MASSPLHAAAERSFFKVPTSSKTFPFDIPFFGASRQIGLKTHKPISLRGGHSSVLVVSLGGRGDRGDRASSRGILPGFWRS